MHVLIGVGLGVLLSVVFLLLRGKEVELLIYDRAVGSGRVTIEAGLMTHKKMMDDHEEVFQLYTLKTGGKEYVAYLVDYEMGVTRDSEGRIATKLSMRDKDDPPRPGGKYVIH